jgi:hypothetical protein
MKTIMTALVALAFNYAATSKHLHNENCKVNCPESTFISAPTPVNPTYRSVLIKNASEEKTAKVQYSRTMQNAINTVNLQKHQEAIKDLAAANSYNNLMAQTLLIIEDEKLNDQLEDLEALQRYENLMVTIFSNNSIL